MNEQWENDFFFQLGVKRVRRLGQRCCHVLGAVAEHFGKPHVAFDEPARADSQTEEAYVRVVNNISVIFFAFAQGFFDAFALGYVFAGTQNFSFWGPCAMLD